MRFNDPNLQKALEQWRQMKTPKERAKADNLWFEQRISTARQKVFENEAKGADDPISLRKSHIDYWEDFVKVDGAAPHTFVAALGPAAYGAIDETQKIVRIEALTRPLNKEQLTFKELRKAFDKNNEAVIDKFLKTWNVSSRDWRPSFAAFKDEVLEELKEDDWPCKLRDRFGLAHYDCANGPIPVALMEYTVDEIIKEAKANDVTCALTAPTVLDSEPWPYFFPSPPELSCGRAMPLFKVDDDEALLAEVLHFRLTYKRHHMKILGEIKTPPGLIDLKELRNHHLTALRMASGDYDYGEEMT